MKVTIEQITPEWASELLEKNTANFRNAQKQRVELYATEMSRGKWQATGDTIKLNPHGVLLDGQHRLLAVVQSGVTIETAVAWDVTTDSLPIDRGKPRSIRQYCKHRGIKYATNLAATARWCMIHDKGRWNQQSIPVHQLPDSEVMEYIEAHRELLYDATRVSSKAQNILTQSILSSILTIACGHQMPSDVPEAVWFANGLAYGNDLGPQDAVLHLRNRLLGETPQNRLTYFMKRILATIAWNKTIRGEPCANLRIRLAGPNKQSVPKYVVRIGDNNSDR